MVGANADFLAFTRRRPCAARSPNPTNRAGLGELRKTHYVTERNGSEETVKGLYMKNLWQKTCRCSGHLW